MSRYIDAERIRLLMKQDRLLQGNCEYELWKQEVDRQVNALPYIELDDYVPKEFHDKTCEAMAKRHQEEIADMVRVVRCKECRHWSGCKNTMHNNHRCGRAENVDYWTRADDFCSYGERKENCKECWYWSEVHKRCENKCGCQFKPYGERSR